MFSKIVKSAISTSLSKKQIPIALCRLVSLECGMNSFLKTNHRFVQTQTQKPATQAPDMFCFQCEQTRDGTGCTTVGVCGKTPDVAALQDLLIQAVKGVSAYTNRAYQMGAKNDNELDKWILDALFSTVTNVNFDEERFALGFLKQGAKIITKAKNLYESTCRAQKKPIEDLSAIMTSAQLSAENSEQLVENAKKYGVLQRKQELGDDYVGLQEMVMYGIKGTAAYAHHAAVLGQESQSIFTAFHKVVDALNNKKSSVDDLLNLAMEVGKLNYDVMKILDHGAVDRYGHPEPTKVRTTAVKGKSIVVSGHDLRDLEEVLKATEGKGINVYTHGELLPAHGYPQLKKYKHLVGNYGSAWQMQKLEFATFPGPIVMTTNCIIEPRKTYKDRIFTRSVVGWPGVKHLTGYDFSNVVNEALKSEGFVRDEKPLFTTTGFARNAVLGSAEEIIGKVKEGKIKHFFLIGGCDGSEGERNYFKEMALNAPKDSLILTLACGKYRFNKFEFGSIDGIPRLIDIGQCNDAYSAIEIASALAKAFNTDVNHLPLSFSISWFEQKAVAVLLTLLSLGIKNIYLGPKLPAFCTPNMLNILVGKFNLHQIGDWKQDMKNMMTAK